jgi:hypothetical protein
MRLLSSRKKQPKVADLQARGDVSGLARMLRDPAAKTIMAAGALGAIGGWDAVGVLVEALADSDPDVRALGALGLGSMSDAANVPILVKVVTASSLPASLRELVSHSVGFMAGLDALELRVGLIRALGDEGGPEAEAILTAWLESSKEQPLRTEIQAALDKARTSGTAREAAPPQPTAQPSAPVTADRIPAVAIACDAYIQVDSDEALNGWATSIVRSKWPGLRLAADTHIESAMGFSGSDDEAKRVLDDLLNRATAAAAVNRADCEVSYFTAGSEAPPMKVWCMVAVKRQSS